MIKVKEGIIISSKLMNYSNNGNDVRLYKLAIDLDDDLCLCHVSISDFEKIHGNSVHVVRGSDNVYRLCEI